MLCGLLPAFPLPSLVMIFTVSRPQHIVPALLFQDLWSVGSSPRFPCLPAQFFYAFSRGTHSSRPPRQVSWSVASSPRFPRLLRRFFSAARRQQFVSLKLLLRSYLSTAGKGTRAYTVWISQGFLQVQLPHECACTGTGRVLRVNNL